ncbi:RIB72 protein, putative [Trichomonas vaginalis G3]|uniref:RIB72 protein, putative n=1 Tax=Trichomonas vaginalis (strain ATCC PRA-98 / G3) TaxID=412133 RepID=A2DP64_TRIV3|nr:EF-Hand domain C-terminal containing protein family [Trichomonas vaginalis G3]EAY17764.1 RIB72 protein, putative [Trichomonas vaginalis G3]KAI5484416.1 EF-Hand domain C-terminal containing protein family [Trichomonas vaginalis G3]|eukprot:XP_001329899.1 RIB72 protein [Trichomonas vaginalis G3]
MDREAKVTFQSKLITPNQEDKQRIFLLTYFVNTKEISIQEGRSPCTSQAHPYYSRGKITNPAVQGPYEPKDFYVGSTITALGRKFYLTDASQATLEFMELHCDLFPMCDLNNAIDYVKETGKAANLKKAFQARDDRGKGFIPVQYAQEILDSARIEPQFVLTILRRFDEKGMFDFGTLSQYL